MVKLQIICFTLILFSSLMLAVDARKLVEKEKIAKFRIYVHDVLGGPNATVYEVARANITSTSPTSFGQVLVADDLMTVGPDPNSQKLGRAQGFAVSTGLDVFSVVVNGAYIFTDGKYKGSSIITVGWKQALGDNQEIPIVGGTGIFRVSRGYTVSNLYSQDPTTNTFTFTFDINVIYKV